MSTNKVAIICGPRGVGKSTKARALVAEALNEGRWVFLHDPVAQYRGLAVTYRSIEEWRVAMAAAATEGKPIARGAAFAIGDALELVTLVTELGAKWNSADASRFPMTLVFDESAMLAQGTHVERTMNELLAMARHRGVQLVFLVQRRSQLSIGYWEMATDVYIFRQPIGRTEEIAGPLSLARGSLDGTADLKKYEYVHVRSGEGPSTAP